MQPDLISRLEQASGPDRELDCLIAIHPALPNAGSVRKSDGTDVDNKRLIATLLDRRAFGIRGTHDAMPDDDVHDYLPRTNADHFGIPHFTGSIDSALTLVPKGAIWKVFNDWPGNFYWAEVQTDGWSPTGEPYVYRSEAEEHPAIALCIAALKAHESMKATELANPTPPSTAGG